MALSVGDRLGRTWRISSFHIESCPITSRNLPLRWQDDICTRFKLWSSAIWHRSIKLDLLRFRKHILPPSCTLNTLSLLPFVASPNQTVMCQYTRYYITKTHGRETLKSYVQHFKLIKVLRYFKIQDMFIKYEEGFFHNCSPFLFPFFEYLTS
jgi:hypothetical protein